MRKIKVLFFTVLTTALLNAQIGIGTNTVTPDKSSILDIQSTTKGLLAPRMTTVQRNAIASPAESLLVYDTDLKMFYTYSGGVWRALGSSGSANRLNYKLIKSTDNLATVLATELSAGGGIKYRLSSNTLYEINGTVTLDKPIDLNSAYIQGVDSGDDKLVSAGNIFDGNTGGSIKGLTLQSTGGKIFNLIGNATQNLIFRDCIVTSSANVGTISTFGMVFISVVQFTNNTTGIIYKDISQLLISNAGWFGDNKGTFEKFEGTFKLIQKQGGFSDVNGAAIGFDVSSDPIISGDAVLESVVFTGILTTGKYVNRYSNGSYSNFNFTNTWNVRNPGIPTETDSNAFGALGANYGYGQGYPFSWPGGNTGTDSKVKLAANSSSAQVDLLRFETDNKSKLTYKGKKERNFELSGSMSYQAAYAGTYRAYLTLNGTIIPNSEFFGKASAINDIVVFPLNGFTKMKNNDYIEVYIERYSYTPVTGGTNPGTNLIPNLTLIVK